ncbi:MAG: YtxH domain-containing protein [Elusimicrobia bacterium]|nr:YtxH domain-containing protein [Elusimicrobiota bacterium]
MAESNSGESSILALLVGGALGVAAGLLLAPRSGRETRERLADWLEDNREKTRDLLERGREAVSEKKDKVSAAWEAGKKAFRESGA